MLYKGLMFILFVIAINIHESDSQSGPDPWNKDQGIPNQGIPSRNDERDIPPDLRIPLKKKQQSENKLGIGGWFFKRTLAIMLKGGQTKEHEDGTIDVSLQMKFDSNQWATLDECLKSSTVLSEDMFRRCTTHIEEAIYKPSITDRIVMAWSDYIQIYLSEYKMHITWTLAALGIIGVVLWLSKHMSYRHVVIMILICFYFYEVVISYKEAEQKELERFLTAVNSCKWYIWASTCEVPPPDPLIFMKYMNPLKIAIRMFTTLISEPMVSFSATVGIMIEGVTSGLWYPFDKILHGILTIIINISLIYILIIIAFNFLLNIPFKFSFLGMNIGVKQRERNLFPNAPPVINNNETQRIESADRISEATLGRILNVCSLALTNVQNNAQATTSTSANVPSIRRSASTGRLPSLMSSFERNNNVTIDTGVRKRKNNLDGSGDAS